MAGDADAAVRAEALAGRIEALLAVKASGGNSPGHKFWGNQWSAHALDPANDPAGEPGGRIKHAVLVIGGKRYRGPSHWQAYQSWSDAQPVGEKAFFTVPALADTPEGFETESGHFLDRAQAARYTAHHDNSLTSEAAEDAGIKLSATSGRLYTRDAVMARYMAEDELLGYAANGDSARSAKALVADAAGSVLLLRDRRGRWDLPGGHVKDGEALEQGLAREVAEETGLTISTPTHKRSVGHAEVFDASVAGVRPAVTLSDEHGGYEWVSPERARDLAAYWLEGAAPALGLGLRRFDARNDRQTPAVLENARSSAADTLRRALVQVVALAEADAISGRQDDGLEGYAEALFVAALAAAYGESAQALAVAAAGEDRGEALTQHEEESYARSRLQYLNRFPVAVRERLQREAAAARAAGDSPREVAGRVRAEGDAILGGAGRGVAETEAQCAAGAAQFRALKRAGFKTAVWMTEQDDRVRDSHTLCEEAGPVRLGDKFPNGLRYPGEEGAPPEEVCNCFPEETIVEWPGLRSVAKRWYDGDVVKVSFAGGNYLTATPNHPVLRGDGVWVAIGSLKEGDHCIGCSLIRHVFTEPDEARVPTKIGDVHRAAKVAGTSERVSVSPDDFHGDVTDCEVEVVTVERKLGFNREPASSEEINQFGLALANQARLSGGGGECLSVVGLGPDNRLEHAAASSFVSGGGVKTFLLGASGGGEDAVGLDAPALPDAGLSEPENDGLAVDTKRLGQLRGAFSGQVAADNGGGVEFNHAGLSPERVGFKAVAQTDTGVGQPFLDGFLVGVDKFRKGSDAFPGSVTLHKVVKVERVVFHGYVFNLDTGEGWYAANGIASQNCRCWLEGASKR